MIGMWSFVYQLLADCNCPAYFQRDRINWNSPQPMQYRSYTARQMPEDMLDRQLIVGYGMWHTTRPRRWYSPSQGEGVRALHLAHSGAIGTMCSPPGTERGEEWA